MQKRIEKTCCVCGGKFACHYQEKPYCNKHYLRMKNNGTIEPKIRARTCTYETIEDSIVITTKKGIKILADIKDEAAVKRYSWCISKTGYAVANINGKVVKMHRYLLGAEWEGKMVDHKNHNTLDNRRNNLRICSCQENARNKSVTKNCSSGHLGIRVTAAGTYQARITHCRKEIQLGTYKTLGEAIKARNEAEDRYHGEFGNHKT